MADIEKPSDAGTTKAPEQGTGKVVQDPPVSADWVARTQFEMAEKIEQRVLRWFKLTIAPFVLVFAFLGYIGVQFTLDYVTHHIESDLTKNTDTLRQRIEDQLADMETRTAELKSEAQEANSNLSTLKGLAGEVKNITPPIRCIEVASRRG